MSAIKRALAGAAVVAGIGIGALGISAAVAGSASASVEGSQDAVVSTQVATLTEVPGASLPDPSTIKQGKLTVVGPIPDSVLKSVTGATTSAAPLK